MSQRLEPKRLWILYCYKGYHTPLTLQRYMTHLADYVDDMELQEGDEESFRGAPLLKELQENRGAAIATMTLEGDEEAERGTFLAEYWAELKEMRWYGKVFALFNFPMTLVRTKGAEGVHELYDELIQAPLLLLLRLDRCAA